jgi:hypothetical protein
VAPELTGAGGARCARGREDAPGAGAAGGGRGRAALEEGHGDLVFVLGVLMRSFLLFPLVWCRREEKEEKKD